MKQWSIYDLIPPDQITLNKPIRLIELFAGYGSQAMALRNIGADFEHYRVIEFDKNAVNSYNAVHGTHFVPTDICDVTGADLGIIERDKYDYIMTYSFPCQDISVAGRRKGLKEDSGTRSSLLWQVKRLLVELGEGGSPQILLMENVKNLVNKTFFCDFQKWLDFLSSVGYTTRWAVLNTKDYGIPQSRTRVFAVSFLDKDKEYLFPNAIPLNIRLKDMLESHIDESFYINNDKAHKLIEELLNRYSLKELLEMSAINTEKDGTSQPILATYFKQGLGCINRDKGIKTQAVVEFDKIKRLGSFSKRKNPLPHEGIVYATNAISPVILTQEAFSPLFITGKQTISVPVDKSVADPPKKTVSNCIASREDRGISFHSKEGTAVVDLTLYNPKINDVVNCISSKDYGVSSYNKSGNGVLEIKQIGNLFKNPKRDNPSTSRVYAVDGVSPTLTYMGGDGSRQPFIVCAMRGRYTEDPGLRDSGLPTEQRLEPKVDGCVNTITSVQKDSLILYYNLRLRKLTPRECLRLQGVSEDDIDKMEAVNSRTQLYKQAGNSITVDVLEALFRQMGIKGVKRWNDLW